MKIHLEFGNEEEHMAMRAIHGSEAFSTLITLDAEMRAFLKHESPRFETARDLASYIRNEISEVLAKIEE